MPYRDYAKISTAVPKRPPAGGARAHIAAQLHVSKPPDPRRGAGLMGGAEWNSDAVNDYIQRQILNPNGELQADWNNMGGQQNSVIINTVAEMSDGSSGMFGGTLPLDSSIATLIDDFSGDGDFEKAIEANSGVSASLNAVFGAIINHWSYDKDHVTEANQAWQLWLAMSPAEQTSFAEMWIKEINNPGFDSAFQIGRMLQSLKTYTWTPPDPKHKKPPPDTNPLPFNWGLVVIPAAVLVGFIVWYNGRPSV